MTHDRNIISIVTSITQHSIGAKTLAATCFFSLLRAQGRSSLQRTVFAIVAFPALLSLSLYTIRAHLVLYKMMIDLSSYPAAPFLYVSKTLDLICEPLDFCQNWRDYTPSFLEQPLSHKVGKLDDVIPEMQSYPEFLGNRESSWQLVKEYAFSTSSTSLSVLTTKEAMFVLLVLVILIRTIKAVLLPYFSSIGRRAGRATHGKEWEAANEIRIVKFGEYVFRFLFHLLISIAGIYYFYDKEWWKPGGTEVLWRGLLQHPVDPGMTWYYLVQGAYNLDALVSLLELSLTFSTSLLLQGKFPLTWSKTVRGDFREMCIHHVVTNLLVIGSSHFRLTRIGSMVFLVHDISDVPVDLSKLANFLKWKTVTTICFASMCLCWLVFRLGILPFVIYHSVLTESWMLLDDGRIDPLYYLLYRHFFYYLVGQIILLHVAWFVMFLKMGYLLVKKGEAHDLSEHKNGEKQVKTSVKTNGHAVNGNGSTAVNGYSNGDSTAARTNGHAGSNGTNVHVNGAAAATTNGKKTS